MVDAPRTGASNMALDEALALSVGKGAKPVLRVYGFDPPCITIGRFQPIAGIDTERARAMDIDVVRRPTGGLAILHLHDFTYCLALPIAGSAPDAMEEGFMTVARGILAALDLLGIEAELVKHRSTGTRSAWCFDGEVGVDIEWQGRKVCGSARRMLSGSVLQHGSMFLDVDEDALFSLARDDPRSRPSGGRSPGMATLGEAAGREVRREEVVEAFKAGFGRALGIELEQGTLSEEEDRLHRDLMHSRYENRDWLTSSISAPGGYVIS